MSPRQSPFRYTRVLVLGASGFIGYWVARALRDQGAHLMCVVRSTAGAERLSREHLGTVVLRRDLRDIDALRDWVRALRPSLVLNLAGYGVDRTERDAWEAQRLNVDLVEALAQVMSELPGDSWNGARLVHVGSALEYGTTPGTLREDSPCAPTSAYGRSKLAGTQALQQVASRTGVAACVARLFTVFGPGEHDGRLLPTLLAAAESGAEVPLSEGTQRRDFAYVEEVAEGLLRLSVAGTEPGELVNLATGTMASVRDFTLAAASVLRIPSSRLVFGAVPTRPEEMVNDGVSVASLRALTGWTPDDDIVSGVARTVARRVERAPGTAGVPR